jgi:hypothetical protein
MRLHTTGLPRTDVWHDQPVLLPTGLPPGFKPAFWLAVAAGIFTTARLTATLLSMAGVIDYGTKDNSGLSLAIVVGINLLLLFECALAALHCRNGDVRRATWALAAVAVLGLLNLVPSAFALIALWLIRPRAPKED